MATLKFAGENVDKDQDVFSNALWTDVSNVELIGHEDRGHVLRESNRAS